MEKYFTKKEIIKLKESEKEADVQEAKIETFKKIRDLFYLKFPKHYKSLKKI